MFHQLNIYNMVWLALGFAGQGIFGGRILVQWICSERYRKSVVPVAFWWLSVIGSIFMLIYALHLRDPVIISGQVFGLGVYVRNIFLIYSERKSRSQILSAPAQ